MSTKAPLRTKGGRKGGRKEGRGVGKRVGWVVFTLTEPKYDDILFRNICLMLWVTMAVWWLHVTQTNLIVCDAYRDCGW